MITILKESEETPELKVNTKIEITADCRTYEEYEDEEDTLQFEMNVEEGDLMQGCKEFESELGQELDTPQRIEFKNAFINDAYFDDEDDCTSGKVEVHVQILSESSISDSDLDYISELCTDNLADHLSARVRGTIHYSREFYNPYASDHRGEQEVSEEIDETASISCIFDNITWKRVD